MQKSQVQLRKIEKDSRRKVTFCKRKHGLLKKAFELNVLCNADIAVIIYSSSGNLYQFSNPEMNTILAKYKICSHHTMHVDTEEIPTTDGRHRAEKLPPNIMLLQKKLGNIMGEDLDSLSTRSLYRLEKKLEAAKRKVFNRKIKLLHEETNSLAEEVRLRNQENKTLKTHLRSNGSTQQTIGGMTITV